MAITPNEPATITRYFAPGVTEILWVPSIANTAAPTFAELDAGTALDRDLAEWSGWTVTTNMIATKALRSRYTAQIPGEITTEQSSLTIYADEDQVDPYKTLMARDTDGYIVWADGGLAAAKGDVFPVTVSTVAALRSMDNAAMTRFDFAITAEPQEGVTLPQS